MNWDDVETTLLGMWNEARVRRGSIADGPPQWPPQTAEVGDLWSPLQEAADAAIEEYLSSGLLPRLPSAAIRLVEMRSATALGLCRFLQHAGYPVPQWQRPRVFGWLLWEAFSDVALPALLMGIQDLSRD